MFAASNGFEDAINLLHAEVGLRDLRGQTALIYAVFQDHFEIVRQLTAECGQVDNSGCSALYYAIFFKERKAQEHLDKFEWNALKS